MGTPQIGVPPGGRLWATTSVKKPPWVGGGAVYTKPTQWVAKRMVLLQAAVLAPS